MCNTLRQSVLTSLLAGQLGGRGRKEWYQGLITKFKGPVSDTVFDASQGTKNVVLDGQTERQTGWTDRQTERQTGWTDRQTDSLSAN